MKPILVFLVLILGLPPLIMAQVLSPSVISPNGGSAQNATMYLEWTVGELAVESYRSGENFYTEGFHQPVLVVEPIVDDVAINNRTDETSDGGKGLIRVMPNPVNHFLTVEFDLSDMKDIHIAVTDLQGRVLNTLRQQIEQGKVQVDFSSFVAGQYIMHVRSDDGRFFRSCKISKL